MTAPATEVRSFQLAPYIEDGDLVIESSINGNPCSPVSMKVEQLFAEFLDWRRERYESKIAPGYRQEVFEMIATLRTIAREMELEIDDLAH